MAALDGTDRHLLYELQRNASISIPILSKKLGISSSVLYSRIKRLLRRNIIQRYTIQIDEAKLGIGIRAHVGINRDPKMKNEVHDALLIMPEVISLTEVTGRFDIIITMCVKDLDTLHDTVINGLGKINGIHDTETFVELGRIDKDPEYLKPS